MPSHLHNSRRYFTLFIFSFSYNFWPGKRKGCPFFLPSDNIHIYLFSSEGSQSQYSSPSDFRKYYIDFFLGKRGAPGQTRTLMTCLLDRRLRPLEWEAWRSATRWWWRLVVLYLDECLQIPIKQLSIILGAGPGPPVFLGLRGDVWRPKGREHDYWAWQKSDNWWNTLGHIKTTKPGPLGSLPTPPRSKCPSPPSFNRFYSYIQSTGVVHLDDGVSMC